MLSDPITLYKLMILYMLAHVNFPLTNSQLTDFFLDHEYTTYFTLQQALNELREAGLLKMESIHKLLPLRDHQGRGGYPFLLRIQYLSCHWSPTLTAI